MAKEMLINVSQGEECRIALVEDGHLNELYMERASSTSHVGNIYKGRVSNVEPSIQAAFIDFGLARNGFLHISDLMPVYFGKGNGDVQETVGRKMARRDRPPIQRCLRRGDEIIVQIIKEGIGSKGPTLTTYLSIPGRILVMMPGMGKMGVSRKIEDEQERRRLRQILDSLKPPKDVGFIIRTAGVGKAKTEIQRDLTYLTRLWTNFVKKRDSGPGPMELYTEGDLVTRTVRDVFTTDVDRVIVDDKEVAKRVKEVIKLANPRAKNKVELYEEPVPIFHKFGIEKEIELMHSRHVPLPSGGSLVIDSTEAVVAIDVNSGKFRDHTDAETTAFKTDMEAADEIPRQLKLRDLGGVIICDFIDLRYERHRRELEERLHRNFSMDRAKTKVLRMSQFGIIEITRQRRGPSLKRSIYFDCPHCKGSGLVKTPESMSLDVMRRVAIALNDARVVRVELTVCADVNFYLQNRKRAQIADLEHAFGKRVLIRADANVALDEVKFDLFDDRDGLVYLAELGMSPPENQQQGGGRFDQRPQGRNQRGRGRGGRDQRGPRDDQRHQDHRHGPPPPPREAEQEQDREPESFDNEENVEEELEPREEDRSEGEESAPAETALAIPDNGLEIGPEIGNEAVPYEGGPNFNSNNGGDDNFPRRRRRGRRGRGGRGRRPPDGGGNSNQQPQEQSVGGYVEEYDVDTAEPVQKQLPPPRQPRPPQTQPPRPPQSTVNIPPFEDGPPPDDGAPRRRRRRGGRGRGGRGKPRNAMDNQMDNPSESSPPPPPLPPAPRAAVAERHTPTGSTDRHLVHDEPIAPPPVPRPRSARDLDSIPDDFD